MKEILFEILLHKQRFKTLQKAIRWMDKQNYNWFKLVITKKYYRFVIRKFKNADEVGNIIQYGLIYKYYYED